MAGFVDEDGEFAVDTVEYCDVTARVVGVGTVG